MACQARGSTSFKMLSLCVTQQNRLTLHQCYYLKLGTYVFSHIRRKILRDGIGVKILKSWSYHNP